MKMQLSIGMRFQVLTNRSHQLLDLLNHAHDVMPPRWAEVMARTIDHSVMPTDLSNRSGIRESSQTFPENCPHCGRRVTANAMYCRSCGELLRVPGRVGDGR